MKKTLIVMGSDSDLPVMAGAAKTLESFGVEFETRIVSAHRTPEAARDLAAGAKDSGFGVIIAGAGGAAHLAGVLASHTALPVIGVPIKSALSGFDSLLSTVQMPSGVPVACVAVDGAVNAAILSAQILAVNDPELSEKISRYKTGLADSVINKDRALKENGISTYLQPKPL